MPRESPNKCQEIKGTFVSTSLQSFVQNLVLYPLVNGKPRNGVVPDSSNEAVKAAVSQNVNSEVPMHIHYIFKVITFQRRPLREKGTLISQELKKTSVFRKIRQAWYNAKFVGVKEKKKAALEAKKPQV